MIQILFYLTSENVIKLIKNKMPYNLPKQQAQLEMLRLRRRAGPSETYRAPIFFSRTLKIARLQPPLSFMTEIAKMGYIVISPECQPAVNASYTNRSLFSLSADRQCLHWV